jgi:hypothetical protein
LLDLRLTRGHLGPGLGHLGLRQAELGGGLVSGGLERPGIDLEQEVAGPHE